MRPISVMLAVAGLLCLAGGAQAAPADSLSYALTTPPSQLESGCQGPCDCAVQAVPTYGSFDLIRTGADGVYTYYEIHRYMASFNNGPGAVSLIGTGTYKIDSSAGMQEMTLDLEVWGEPEHFASGLVPVTVPFPELRAECAVHGFACLDSVIVVDAQPLEQVGVPSSPTVFGIQTAWPNPFQKGMNIGFALPQTGRVDLRIVDAAGRAVRMLLSGASSAALRSASWDGRTDEGRVAPPGVYWAVLRWSGGEDRRRLVKLD